MAASSPSPPSASSPPPPSPIFHPTYSFPPFFTKQPNVQTLSAQLSKWSSLIQKYCRHHRMFKLFLPDALESPLFHNAKLKRRLSSADATAVIDYMASKDGDHRAEWIGPSAEKTSAWIWWLKPEEWAEAIEAWVDETGQKGTVLTLYELAEGEATQRQVFHGMDIEVLRRSLVSLVKKGRAQIFGGEGQEGVKFF